MQLDSTQLREYSFFLCCNTGKPINFGLHLLKNTKIYLVTFFSAKPPSREGSRDRGLAVPPKAVPQKDSVDKHKRNSNVSLPTNHRDKNCGSDMKDKNVKMDSMTGSLPSVASSASVAGMPTQKPVSGIPAHMTKSMSASVLPVHHEASPVKTLNVPKPRSPTPPEDPTLPTRYLDITQFKAPEDLEGEVEHQKPPVSNPNPDMNQLTLMLQQGMSIPEVAKAMNIKLDEQTHELLSTLKQQLDLATALAKQSTIGQGSTVPGQGEVGKTYDYSDVNFANAGENNTVNDVNQKPGENTGVQVALNQMLTKQQGQVVPDYRAQDPAYPQARDPSGSVYYTDSRDPYSQRPLDTSVGDVPNTSFSDKGIQGENYSSYGADSLNRTDIPDSVTYGEFNRDPNISSGLNSEIHSSGFSRYNSGDSRSGSVQKQYSYGSDYSDSEGAQKISSHRNSSSSSYSGGASGGLIGSPPFRNTGDSHIGTGSGPGFGRQASDEGKFNRGHGSYGNKPQGYKGGQSFGRGGPQPLMAYDSGRGRGRHGRGGYREKW